MNAQEIIAAVRAQQGLTNIAPYNWTYTQRTDYNKALAAAILANQSAFNPTSVETAQNVVAAVISPLADTSILSDVNTFAESFGDNLLDAGNKIGDIGRGVLNVASLMKYALPIAALIIGGIFILKLYKEQVPK